MPLIAAVDGVALRAWQSLRTASIFPAGHCLQNSPAARESSWNSGCIQHGVVEANSSYPAKVGRTAISVIAASADEVGFEVLLKNTYLKQAVLEAKLLKIYANNF